MAFSLLTTLSALFRLSASTNDEECGHFYMYPLAECVTNNGDSSSSFQISCSDDVYEVEFFDDSSCSDSIGDNEFTTNVLAEYCLNGGCSCSSESCETFTFSMTETCGWDDSSGWDSSYVYADSSYGSETTVILDVCIPADFGDDTSGSGVYLKWSCNPDYTPGESAYYEDSYIPISPVIPTYYEDSDCSDEYDWDSTSTWDTTSTDTYTTDSSNDCDYSYDDNDCSFQISDGIGECSFYSHFPINMCMHQANDYGGGYIVYASGGDSTTSTYPSSLEYTCFNEGGTMTYSLNTYTSDDCTGDLLETEDVTSVCTDDPTLCNCNAVDGEAGDSTSCNVMQVGSSYTCSLDSSSDWYSYTLYVKDNCIGNAQYECYSGYTMHDYQYEKRSYSDSTCTEPEDESCRYSYDSVCDYNGVSGVDTGCGYIYDSAAQIESTPDGNIILDVCYSYSSSWVDYYDTTTSGSSGSNAESHSFNCTNDNLGNSDSIKFYTNYYSNTADCSGDISWSNDITDNCNGGSADITCQCGDGLLCNVAQLTSGDSCTGGMYESSYSQSTYYRTNGECVADNAWNEESAYYMTWSCSDAGLEKVIYEDNACTNEREECADYYGSDNDYTDYEYSCTEKASGDKCGYISSYPLGVCQQGSTSYSTQYTCDDGLYWETQYSTSDCTGTEDYISDVSDWCDYSDCSCVVDSNCGVGTSIQTNTCTGDVDFWSSVIGECIECDYCCSDDNGDDEICWYKQECDNWEYYSDDECENVRSSYSSYDCEVEFEYDDDDKKTCKSKWGKNNVHQYNLNIIIFGILFIVGLF